MRFIMKSAISLNNKLFLSINLLDINRSIMEIPLINNRVLLWSFEIKQCIYNTSIIQ